MSDIILLNSIFTEDLSNTIFDLDRLGGLDQNGQIEKVYGENALTNAVYLWVKSQRGERLRDPEGGGYVAQYLQKPVNETTQSQLREAIIAGFEQDFQPLLTISSLELIAIEDRAWRLKISAASRELKLSVNIEEILETNQ